MGLDSQGDVYTAIDATYTLPNDTSENTVVELTQSSLISVDVFELDLSNLVQDVTIRVYKKMDGSNYRQLYGYTLSWTTSDEDGVDFASFKTHSDFKVTIQSGSAQGATKDIPYYYAYRTL